jgi:hypothetical protein
VMSGTQAEGQTCDISDDCKPGLVCPRVQETGASTCTGPAAANQTCVSAQPSVGHPACAPGLYCALVGENPSCITPPCPDYRCVPPLEEGERCVGLECASGLSCNDGKCSKAGPTPVGGSCSLTDHCAAGNYCDPSTAKCTARKSTGAACTDSGNFAFECNGLCSNGVCVAFCSSP